MALDWDNIEIIAEDENIVQLTDWNAVEIISEENEIIKLSDSNIINVDAMDRMIIFGGERGERGKPGPQGPAGKIRIGTTTTLPAGSAATVVNRGTDDDAVLDFGIPKGVDGDNAPVWGNISGTLADQTDLQNALSAKADTADLGDMANIDDAPSDNKEYARKNGAWSEVQGGISSVTWGDITGSLSNQTDIQNALDAKANTADLGALASLNSIDYTSAYLTNKPALGSLASKNSVDYDTEVTNKPTLGTMAAVNDAASDGKAYARKDGAWYDLDGRYYTESEIDSALSGKVDTASLDEILAWLGLVFYNGGLYVNPDQI